MKLNAKRGFLLVVGFVLAAAGVFGQGLAVKKVYTLTINVNVAGAQIYVDNKLINGTSVPVVEGRHSVRVHANGFFDFTQNVDVAGNMSVPVALRPITFPLSVRPNVGGAFVFVDGVDTRGQPAAVSQGQHTVLVQAPGYQDYTVVVDVESALTVPVSLQPSGFALTVNANVAGASVTINNVAKGGAPYMENLPPGTYTVRVSADGFSDYLASVSLDRPMTVVANLTPRTTTLALVIPPTFLDPDQKANDIQGQVRIFIDNRLANVNRTLDNIPITPGRHRIRVAVGGLSIDVGDVMVAAGQRYVIELSLAAQLKAVQQ